MLRRLGRGAVAIVAQSNMLSFPFDLVEAVIMTAIKGGGVLVPIWALASASACVLPNCLRSSCRCEPRSISVLSRVDNLAADP